MATLPEDPFEGLALTDFSARLKRREVSCTQVTAACLERIAALDARLNAFVHVAHEDALRAAHAIDALVAAGIDLGPLMGLPVAVKDLFTVAGMPTTAGSRLDIADLVPPEGPFVQALKRAGCVILGKTRTTEFAVSMTNVDWVQPWNPCDAAVHRMPGGSSSGSAVAVAAGLCAFAVGTDTGGSVRQPAAHCGVFGFKASATLWPREGVFPLSTTLDSLGFFARSACDAAMLFAGLTGRDADAPRPARALTLALPGGWYGEQLDLEVEQCMREAQGRLRAAGADFVPVDVPEAGEADAVFARLVPAELIATLGRERFSAGIDLLDPVARARGSAGLDAPADDYVRFLRRHDTLRGLIAQRMRGVDGWLAAATPLLPLPVRDVATLELALAWNRRATRNTRPGNLFGQCGVSLPVHHLGAPLPVGLQIMGAPDDDAALLACAQAVEAALGRPPLPDVSSFLN